VIGKTVIATNDAGARYRGVARAELYDGRVIVACEWVDIGNGWEREKQERTFRIEQVDIDDSPTDAYWYVIDLLDVLEF